MFFCVFYFDLLLQPAGGFQSKLIGHCKLQEGFKTTSIVCCTLQEPFKETLIGRCTLQQGFKVICPF
jgi:hypothetical protein